LQLAKDIIEEVFNQLCTYLRLNGIKFQMNKDTAKAAPAQHAIAKARHAMGISLAGSRCVSCSLGHHCREASAEEFIRYARAVRRELMQTGCGCQRLPNLKRIHIQYLELIKAKESMDMLHLRILPGVLGKLRDGRHVGLNRMDGAQWQQISEKAAS